MVIARGGPLAHLFRPIFKLITKSWHMYPLGFLFGLGFDTATEVAFSQSRPRKPLKAFRSGRCSSFPRYSPPECHWWTLPTAF